MFVPQFPLRFHFAPTPCLSRCRSPPHLVRGYATFASSCHPTRFPTVRPQNNSKGHTEVGCSGSGCANKCAHGYRTTSRPKWRRPAAPERSGCLGFLLHVGLQLKLQQTSHQFVGQTFNSVHARTLYFNICTRTRVYTAMPTSQNTPPPPAYEPGHRVCPWTPQTHLLPVLEVLQSARMTQ
ncbi:unnamed protein product, partial [Ectocarpus fasciculatus]